MAISKERLLEKGWTEEEANKALGIIHSPDKKEKHIQIKKDMNRVLYWSGLLVLTVCNLLVAVFLIPALLLLKGIFVYVIVGIIALIFGLLFNLIVRDIEHLEVHHHIIAASFIPAISIINMAIMVSVSNRIDDILQLGITQNPILISLTYVVVFILPYLIHGLMLKK